MASLSGLVYVAVDMAMRITGGEWRSRVLKAPRGDATRPTSDRVREALFSMLASDGLVGAPGLRVLDLYAGSGALAFEALSRGAEKATLVEHSRDALAAIKENARTLGASAQIELVSAKVDRALARLEAKFGLVFLDPPYADVKTDAFAQILALAARAVTEDGALVLEHASGDAVPEVPGLVHDRSRRHGDTTLSLFRPAASA